ncbi:MAG: hypothetical protein AB2705_16240 [Candidatus Thiodiazotropha sp.]
MTTGFSSAGAVAAGACRRSSHGRLMKWGVRMGGGGGGRPVRPNAWLVEPLPLPPNEKQKKASARGSQQRAATRSAMPAAALPQKGVRESSGNEASGAFSCSLKGNKRLPLSSPDSVCRD